MYSFLYITSAENFYLSFSNSSTEISHLCSMPYRSTSWINQTWSSQCERIIILSEWRVWVEFCFKLDQITVFIYIWEHSFLKIYNRKSEVNFEGIARAVIYIIIEWQNLYFPTLSLLKQYLNSIYMVFCS